MQYDTIHPSSYVFFLTAPEKAERRYAMQRKKVILKIVFSGTAMLAVMTAIFLFSAQTGSVSSQTGNSVGAFVLRLLGIEVPPGQSPSSVPILFGLNIRKCAHVFIYMLLGLTAFLFVSSLFCLSTREIKYKLLYIALATLAICFVYACLDEWHQSFVAGRAAALSDVGIDSIGFITATLLCSAVRALRTLSKK